MKALALFFSLFFILNTHTACLDNAFSNGFGHMNNIYQLDEPPTCCDDVYQSAKGSIREILKSKLSCSDSETKEILSNPIECLGSGVGVCQMEVGTIVIQVAIEHGAQPYTHIIFNDNH